MCFRINYLYQCGHEEEEEEQHMTCQQHDITGFCCDEYTEQNVVMPDKCVTCRVAGKSVVLANYLYQCGHEEQERYETCQQCIDAGFCCDKHEEQNVVMHVICVTCKLAAMRAEVEQQSKDAEMVGGEEEHDGILQWE